MTDIEPADDEVTAALELELVLAPDVTLGALVVVLIVKESALLPDSHQHYHFVN